MSSNSNIVVSFKDVHKSFVLKESYQDELKSYFANLIKHLFSKKEYKKKIILDNVSFNIKKGEVVGFIGKNGVGKTTLLTILCEIIQPQSGTIKIDGTVAPLLGLGSGFHHDLSGYENIYLNGVILGMSIKEIDEKIEEIIEFSGIREYIHEPIKVYSSGMLSRLAFSIAINRDADIIIIDETLSVGDKDFSKKSFDALQEYKKRGKTIILVSHDLGTVQKFCDRVIWLENGKIKMDGIPSEVIKQYSKEN
jgi:ABC-type polysaccharide/polyol phosphate transport system ATPase subunit